MSLQVHHVPYALCVCDRTREGRGREVCVCSVCLSVCVRERGGKTEGIAETLVAIASFLPSRESVLQA